MHDATIRIATHFSPLHFQTVCYGITSLPSTTRPSTPRCVLRFVVIASSARIRKIASDVIDQSLHVPDLRRRRSKVCSRSPDVTVDDSFRPIRVSLTRTNWYDEHVNIVSYCDNLVALAMRFIDSDYPVTGVPVHSFVTWPHADDFRYGMDVVSISRKSSLTFET